MVQAPEWKISHDAWLECQDGIYVRWSAIEMLGTAPSDKSGWDVYARLHRGGTTVGHYETKDAAEQALKDLLGRLSGHYQ